MNADFAVLLCIYLASVVTRTSFELLKKAGKIRADNTKAFIIVVLGMILMWVCWFWMCPLDPLRLAMPKFVHIAGLVLLLVGIVLAVAAFVRLKARKQKDRLVTTGLYALVRHPMYIGFVFWILGWSVYQGALVSFLAGLAGIANIVFWTRREEVQLLSVYGEEYEQFKKRTPL